MAGNNGVGLVHVYTGTGKGKTTASLGLAMRALGHGMSVCMIQFLKGGSYFGELFFAKKLPNFTILQFGDDCPWAEQMMRGEIECGVCRYCFSVYSEEKKRTMKAFEVAKSLASSDDYDMLILDEINVAMSRKLIPIESVLSLIDGKHPLLELVLTGRNAPREIIERADIVTEMREIKHAFWKGTGSRKGREY
ncbi:MAG: cob(I)yrinic acid a,c-diamide adenosyltransferase [Candidatus Micrarchaeia archaeon]